MSFIDKLDLRLKTIAKMVDKGSRLADIGCDHGLLVCALAKDEIITKGIACDVNPKPLSNAVSEIAKNWLENIIDCRLCDGLKGVEEQEVDCIVIAGMGGELIAEIIEACNWTNLGNKQFILQPMSKAPFLRFWLCVNGFNISEEKACVSNNLPYTVMRVKYTGNKRKSISQYDLYCYAGELPLDNSPYAKIYLRQTLSGLKKKLLGMRQGDEKELRELTALCNRLTTVIDETP